MKIDFNSQTSFKRRLKPAEEKEFSNVLQQGKKAVGNKGMSVLIVPSSSLPKDLSSNIGVGNLLNKESEEFFKFARQYWGVDTVQLLPEGNFRYGSDGRILPYSGSTLDFGNQIINLEILTKDEYGKLITEEDLKSIANLNKSEVKNSLVNYENVITTSSPTENVLKKAYKELLIADTEEKRNLLKQFENFEKIHADRLEPKSLFYALTDNYNSSDTRNWSKLDHNLFDREFVTEAQATERIKQIKDTKSFEVRFYNFKQFLAENHLELAKENLHKQGLKLSGDMPCGFSYSERWANPKAFHPFKYALLDWGLPAINLETPEGEALLREKVKHYASKYDKIRIDAAWTYSSQPLTINDVIVDKKEYGGKFISIIEDEVKKVKGSAFKNEDIMYELAADPKIYSPFNGSYLKPEVQNRVKIYCSDSLDKQWGSTQAYKNRNWKDGSYILGASNHDSELYKVLSDEARKKTQIETLSEILKIPKEKLSSSKEFIKAKYAEIMRSEHNMFFFTDILNLKGKYQGNAEESLNYRIKIPENYQENYFKSLEKGEGLNIMDALEKAFKAEGLDKSNKDLYKKIQKYKKILQEPSSLAKNKVVAILLSSAMAIVALSVSTVAVFKNSNQHQDTI